MAKKGFHMTKSVMKTDTKGLEKRHFHYGPGMQDEWIESNDALLEHVGIKYGQSARSSLSSRRLLVSEVNDKLLPKFEMANDKKKHLETLA